MGHEVYTQKQMSNMMKVKFKNLVLEVRMDKRDVFQLMSLEKDLLQGADQDHHLLHLVNKYTGKGHFNY